MGKSALVGEVVACEVIADVVEASFSIFRMLMGIKDSVGFSTFCGAGIRTGF